MKNKIEKFLYNLNYKIFLKNIILFESNPDFSDNTRGLFDRMIEKKYNDKYNMIWIVNDEKKFNKINIKNVKFINRKKKLNIIYYRLFAKYIIDCNIFINKLNKYQFRIHLTHGSPIKMAKEYCSNVGEVDYITQISDFFTKANMELFGVEDSKLINTGFPRNDILLNSNNIFFEKIKRKKTIIWLPTYRNHKKNDNTNSKFFKYGIPVIENYNQLKKLNEILKQKEILLLIKLHPAEDRSGILTNNLSNIILLEEEYFEKNNLTIYHYLNSTDAFITDYSSIYYDYLLTNKPIGLTISDLGDYKKHTQLVFDNYKKYIIGEYIENFEDLCEFVKNVALNLDKKINERNELKKAYFDYIDNNSSDRILEYLKLRMEK